MFKKFFIGFIFCAQVASLGAAASNNSPTTSNQIQTGAFIRTSRLGISFGNIRKDDDGTELTPLWRSDIFGNDNAGFSAQGISNGWDNDYPTGPTPSRTLTPVPPSRSVVTAIVAKPSGPVSSSSTTP